MNLLRKCQLSGSATPSRKRLQSRSRVGIWDSVVPSKILIFYQLRNLKQLSLSSPPVAKVSCFRDEGL